MADTDYSERAQSEDDAALAADAAGETAMAEACRLARDAWLERAGNAKAVETE